MVRMYQKSKPPLAPIRVPIVTRIAQNGRIKEMNARDSPNASTSTMGPAHDLCSFTNAMMASA
jgi:hypothetical protein